jgi:hypothetical protein
MDAVAHPVLILLQDYEVGLACLGDGKRSSGGCDTCILIDLIKNVIAWRWGAPIKGWFGMRFRNCLYRTRFSKISAR